MAEIIHHLYTSECQRRFASQVQRFSGGKESERDPIGMVREPGLYVDVDWAVDDASTSCARNSGETMGLFERHFKYSRIIDENVSCKPGCSLE